MIPIKLLKKFFFLVYIKLSNINQNNEIENINKKISLLEDRLKINDESKNQLKNVLMQIKRLQLKQGQRTNLSETKKVQKIYKVIFKNKINNIKDKKNELLKNALVNVQKRDYLKKD